MRYLFAAFVGALSAGWLAPLYFAVDCYLFLFGELSDLQMLLASLKLGNNERYAARYANLVQSSLVSRLRKDYSGTVDLGVKRGPFLVLFQADMPAILVEVGFVSNPAEGKRMRSRDFARAAAEGIADGVSAYREQQERSIFARR